MIDVDRVNGHGLGRRRGGFLRHGDPAAVLLQDFDSFGPVGALAGQNDSDRPGRVVFGQGKEEMVDGTVCAREGTGREMQRSRANFHQFIRRDNVDMIGEDARGLRDLSHRHPGRAGQDFGQQALGAAQDMAQQNERHVRIDGQIPDELTKGVQASRRGSDGNDAWFGGGFHGRCRVVVSPPPAQPRRRERRPASGPAVRRCARGDHPGGARSSRIAPARRG